MLKLKFSVKLHLIHEAVEPVFNETNVYTEIAIFHAQMKMSLICEIIQSNDFNIILRILYCD